MKKILFLSTMILVIIVTIFGITLYKYHEYNKADDYKEKISNLEKDITNIREEIDTKKKEVDNLKNGNVEKNGVLEVWEKELKKVKRD